MHLNLVKLPNYRNLMKLQNFGTITGMPKFRKIYKFPKPLKFINSMWNNTVDNKICNLNFSVTFNLSDKSRESTSSS